MQFYLIYFVSTAVPETIELMPPPLLENVLVCQAMALEAIQ